MFINQFKGLIMAGALASMGLSACVVSDNPYTNAAATTAAIGVASMLFYSLSDGYYYDQSYNRMPRNYHPEAHIPVQRVSSMDDYRRQHPQPQYQRGSQRGQYQQPAYSNHHRSYDNSGCGRYQNNQYDDYQLNLQSKCNKKRSTHQLEYNFVSTQKPLPNDEYFLPTSYNKRARKDNDFTRTGQKTSRNCQSIGA